MRLELLLFLSIIVLPATPVTQTTDTGSVVVRNGTQQARLEAADLARLPRRSTDATDGGQAVRFEGVRLSDVREQAGVTLGQTMRTPRPASGRWRS